MSLAQAAQSLHDATPGWLNTLVIVGGAAVGWLQPAAAVVAIVWGLLQIYGWFVNRGWRRKGEK